MYPRSISQSRLNDGSVVIAVVGLGYVGLPLAAEFGKHFDIIGFDINATRIQQLRNGVDHTRETSAQELADSTRLSFSTEIKALDKCTVFIVTVPTPVDEHKRPDLTPLIKASQAIGGVLKRCDIVVYESTVYPGCTEEVCVPLLGQHSGLKFNTDFFAGYSPERINPGDKEHRVTSSRPYQPHDTPAPLNVYGRSKWAGEQAVRAAQPDALILRTAWVYSVDGANFVKTMLKLMATRDTLGVVADQIGTPTSADGLAQALWLALERGLSGIHHWTDAGVASWYDFAVAIAEEVTALGLLARAPELRPIRIEDYPTPARRPAYSVLDKTATWGALDLASKHWRDELRATLREMRDQQA